MDYFPAFLELHGRPCLLVGGGAVASRKARLLLSAGADLLVVSPWLTAELVELREQGKLRHEAREFRDSDVAGHWLVVSATGDPSVEKRVFAIAEEQRIFCNAVDDKASCSYITPAIVDRNPILVAISSGGSAPVLARRIRSQIETMLPTSIGDLAKLAASWRDRVKERLQDFGQRLRFWERFFERPFSPAASRVGDDALELLLDAFDEEAVGEAWLVGAGPGDPGLVTLKAMQCMQAADVILHDRLVSSAVLDLARRDADRISVGKQAGCNGTTQEEINTLLVRLVSEGKRVCRLKGGDPFIFGRGGEEAEALEAAGLRYSVVPGITAAAGCAAAARIPLTHRDASQSLVLVTAHGKEGSVSQDWPALARDRQTLAVYMGVSRFPQLCRDLIDNGRAADTPVAIIENGTLPDQRVIRGTLGQLPLLSAAHRVKSPAMLIIGEVSAIRCLDQDSPADAVYKERLVGPQLQSSTI